MTARAIDELGYLLYPRNRAEYRAYNEKEIQKRRTKVYQNVLKELHRMGLYNDINETIQYLATSGNATIIEFILIQIQNTFLWYTLKNGISVSKPKNIMSGVEYVCSWTPRLTISAATSIKTNKTQIEIDVPKQMFAYGVDYDSGNEVQDSGAIVYKKKYESRKLFGIQADNALEILIVLLEHEMCHAILQFRSPRRDESLSMDRTLVHGIQCDSHHNKYFTDLAHRLFGHNMIVTRIGMVGKRRSGRLKF